MRAMTSDPAHRAVAVRRLAFADASGDDPPSRQVPIEAPVSIEIDGIGYAVMMATPADLDDYALGFLLTEGLVSRPDQIHDLFAQPVDGGWVLRITLADECADAVFARARRRVAESGCGLCGIETMQQALRPLPPVSARIATDAAAIARALAGLWAHQPLGQITGAVHAAAFCTPDGEILHVREDVGRHNALDKLFGALAGRGIGPSSGFVLLSARCGYELVEKTARMNCPMLVSISAPTSLAVERAMAAGLTLVSLARPDSALVVCDTAGNIR